MNTVVLVLPIGTVAQAGTAEPWPDGQGHVSAARYPRRAGRGALSSMPVARLSHPCPVAAAQLATSSLTYQWVVCSLAIVSIILIPAWLEYMQL